ncbi:MAG: peptidylprolyl isomerase [Pseudomonadota bacterium]
MRRFVIFAAFAMFLLPYAASAQSPFRTVATVDEAAITAFELDQRQRFLTALGRPGITREIALRELVEDKLKLAAATRAGLGLSPEGSQRAMEEFAGRANVSLDEAIRNFSTDGIEETTLRDYVEVSVLWRELIRARFNARAQISEEEIDRALAQSGSGGSIIRVLLNEIILPARPIGDEIAVAERNAERLQEITSISQFQDEASRLSVSQSRQNGGQLDWVRLDQLPGGLRPIVLGLRPGEVSEPIQIENAIVLFQLRAIEETEGTPAASTAIDYAALYLQGGRSEATLQRADQIAERVDNCDDLYGEASNMAPEALERGAKTPEDIPQDVAIELAKLDANEVSTSLTRANGQTLVFLMLCSRVPTIAEDADREEIRNRLRSQRLSGFADGFLAELLSEAVITVQ